MSIKIIHIDMDCFYAAVEVRDNPQLKGHPVAVGGAPDQRGVLSTCNYEARQFGLHSAMSTAVALRRCPSLILLPVSMDKYRRVSQQIHAIFRRYTAVIEPVSLDEAYLDVSQSSVCEGSATWLAVRIRQEIQQETALTASAGIAPNKFLAKVASEWQKPNGQFTIPPEAVEAFVMTLQVKKIPGVGHVTAGKLQEMGIETCGQLQAFSQAQLLETFGKFGLRLYDYSRGIDHRSVQADRMRKSVSVEHTFFHDLSTLAACQAALPTLYQQLCKRLSKYRDRVVHKQVIKIKFSDFTQVTKECVVSELILETFFILLARAMEKSEKPVRLLGIGVRFRDSSQGAIQKSLFFNESSILG